MGVRVTIFQYLPAAWGEVLTGFSMLAIWIVSGWLIGKHPSVIAWNEAMNASMIGVKPFRERMQDMEDGVE